MKAGTGNAGMNLCGNFQERFGDVALFHSSIRETVCGTVMQLTNEADADGWSCYDRIANEIHRLSRSNARRKMVVIDSSLLERSSCFDATTEDGRKLVSKNPWAVAKLFNSRNSFVYLRGVHVIFTYNPTNADDARRYYDMIEVYKCLLTCCSARVTIVHAAKAFTNG